jgi:prevent-host-death family protein
MTTASIAELKARLSEFLAVARRGDDVVITDRGRPVARLTGLGPAAGDGRMAELVRAGTVRPPQRDRPAGSGVPSPAVDDDGGLLLDALLRERDEGR